MCEFYLLEFVVKTGERRTYLTEKRLVPGTEPASDAPPKTHASTRARATGASRDPQIKFAHWAGSIKGEVKKKHHRDGLRFSSFAAQMNKRDVF